MIIVILIVVGILLWGIFSGEFLAGVMNAALYGFIAIFFLSLMTMGMLFDDAEITETKLLYEHELLEIKNNGSVYYVSLDVGSDEDVYEVIYLDEDSILEYLELHEDNIKLVETGSDEAVVRVYEQKLTYNYNSIYQIPLFLSGTKQHYEIVIPEGTILHRFNINK